jgi:hypothetical protein
MTSQVRRDPVLSLYVAMVAVAFARRSLSVLLMLLLLQLYEYTGVTVKHVTISTPGA